MTSSNGAVSSTVCSLIQRTATLYPSATAVESQEFTLTYEQLDRASQVFSQRLAYHGIQKTDFVACCGNRSPETMVAILAILKAGACIVPIDAETWGQDRIGKTLKIAAPKLIVCTTDAAMNLDSKIAVLRFSMKELTKLLESGCDDATNKSTSLQLPNGSDLAYTVFTSGTTGAPKGVMVRHSSLAHYVQQNEPHAPFNLNARLGSRVLLVYSIAFDACLGVIFSTICNGGTVVLATSTNYTDVAKSCTILPLTPSILATFNSSTDEYDDVESIFLGGENPAPQIFNSWFNGKRRLFNCYGPTESTCASLIKELLPGSEPNILEHTVAQSTVILVEDGSDEKGQEGEILISGPGLALGYLDNENLTICKFRMLKGTRYYCTGDYGRKVENGIQFLGRKDRTVKNRGFLINLDSEVERPLSALPGIGAVAAFMHNGYLVAFLTPKTVDVARAKSELQKSQDLFTIPERLYTRDKLPLTLNGKTDIAALRTALDNNLLAPIQNKNTCRKETETCATVKEGFSEILKIQLTHLHGDSSFLGLGGNSLSAVGMVSFFRRQRFTCQVQQIFQMDTIDKISTVLLPIRNETAPQPQLVTPAGGSLPDSSGTERLTPMSTVQLKIIQSTLLHPMLNYIKVDMLFKHKDSTFDSVKLRRAWAALCSRHSVLRLEFVPKLEMALIRNDAELEWTESRYESAHEWQSAVDETDANWMTELEPLDPDRPRPRMKLSCRTQDSQKTQFSWIVHHSLVDGWSVALILEELGRLLNAQSLPPAPQFATAVTAQQHIRKYPGEKALQLWLQEKESLSDIPKLGLPKPISQSQLGSRLQLTRRLGISLNGIQAFAKRCLVSDMAIFLTAWGLVISKYCGRHRVVCGAVLSGRNLPIDGADCIVGPLLSTVPISMDFSPQQNIEDAVLKVHNKLHRINETQWEFEKLASALPSPPALETLVSLQYDVPDCEWPNTDSFPPPSSWKHTETTELPLHALVDADQAGVLQVRFLVDAKFCDELYASQLLDHYVAALCALPLSLTVSNVMTAMLGQLEMNKLLFSYPDLKKPYHGFISLKEAFEAAADSWPDLIALEAVGRSYTYSQLDRASNMVAASLADLARPGDVVAILADASPEWVIAILAVLKVGAAYCPVDISLPPERIDTILTESQSKCLLKSSIQSPSVGKTILSVLEVKEILSRTDRAASAKRLPTISRGRDSAVIIFTSGSTGKPKGIALEHIGILSLLDYPNARLRSRPGRRNAQFLSLGFDCCVNEVFATLCHGATLVLKDTENPTAHLSTVDVTMCTPSFLSTLDRADYPNLKMIALAGESVPQRLVDSWGHGRTLLNVYSPSECTISAVYPELQPNKAVTLGRPVPRMAIYVLDDHLCPCPVGVVGEIYLSGIQVTKGYLNLENETKKRFLANPWIRGWTMYKSGDLGRLTADYEIECLGRCDNQVKIRGYRVEPEEVEASILSLCTDVLQAVVVAHLNTLVAFVSPTTVDTAEVSLKLNKRLPPYCQPSHIIAINDIPTTANQKVDRRGLASSVGMYLRDHCQSAVTMQLVTPTEKLVQKIWKDVTEHQTREIGGLDRFDQIGGHSLLYQKVIRRLYAELGVRVPFRVVVENQVLRDLAVSIDEIGIDQDKVLDSVTISSESADASYEEDRTTVASHLEREMYLVFKLAPNSAALNMVYSARIQGLNVEAFKMAMSTVLGSNDILRSRFIEKNGQVFKKIEQVKVESVTSKLVPNASVEAESLANQALDPEDSLVKAYILGDESNSSLVMVIMSHLIGDRATLAEMLAAIETCYNDNVDESTFEMPRRIISAHSYRSWAEHQEQQQVSPTQTSFWAKFTKCCHPQKPVFGQFDVINAMYGSFTLELDQVTTKALDKVQADASLSGHQLATTLIGLTVAGLKGRDNLLIAAPFRDPTSISLNHDRYGLFLDRVVIPLQLGSSLPANLWPMVKEASEKAIANFIPFTKLKQCLGLSGKANSLCEIVVTYHEQPMRSLRPSRTQICEVTIRPRGVKFPLLFEVSKLENALRIDIDYDARIISVSEVERIAARLGCVLRNAATGEPLDKITDELQTVSFPTSDAQVQVGEDGGNQNMAKDALVDTVRLAMAKCLGLESKDVGASTSFFDIGATSMDSLLLRHLLMKEGVHVTLGAILNLNTARMIASSANLLN